MCGDGPSVHNATDSEASSTIINGQESTFTTDAAHACHLLTSMGANAAQDSNAPVACCPNVLRRPLGQFPLERQIVPAPFEGDEKVLQLIINVDKEAKNPDSEDGLRAIKCIGAIESIAKNFIFHARNFSLCLSRINDRNYVEF